MYESKLAAAIKVGGKVLREFKDTVYIKFGSEYSILIKNLNTVRAVVNVFVDGENAVPGGLVVDPGREVDLERWIKNGNLSEGNRFKFIERTSGIEQHRGIKLEDGLIRIEYQFEQPVRPVLDTWKDQWHQRVYNSPYYGAVAGNYNVNGVLRSADFSKGELVRSVASAATAQYCADNNIVAQAAVHDGMATMGSLSTTSFNDAGITVPGSKSEQKFSTTSVGILESTKHTMVFKLLGETPDNKPVLQTVTVKAKPRCSTCGKQNKATAKFCAECGTHLAIYA